MAKEKEEIIDESLVAEEPVTKEEPAGFSQIRVYVCKACNHTFRSIVEPDKVQCEKFDCPSNRARLGLDVAEVEPTVVKPVLPKTAPKSWAAKKNK